VIVSNYLGDIPTGKDNHVNNWRVDYDLSAKHRLSSVGIMGTYGYLNNWGSPYLPLPYTGGDMADIYPKDYVIGDTWTVSPNLVNQLKYSYTRFFQNIYDSTAGVTAWEAPTLGITGLPPGQAGIEFPGASFGTTAYFGNGQQTWTSNGNSIATQLTTPNNYALTDNVQWLKGKHALTFGGTLQFENINNANPATYTGVLDLAYNAYSTANFAAGSNALNTGNSTTPSGYAYASYLLGAVGGSPSIGLQPVSEEGGRYLTMAPYFEDIFRVTQKLTLDLGMRWDYLPPYHEVKNRWTYLNPYIINPLTNLPGMLEFAGRYGGPGVSCMCNTPVQTYWKNWGPRLSAAYELNPKTVFRAGYAQVFSQGGGVGGRGGATGGTGQTGFNMTAIAPSEVTTGAAAGPSFYLNNGSAFTSAGLANTTLFGAGFTYPSAPVPSLAAQELNTGFYLNAAGTAMVTASSVNFADFYLSGRAPELELWNAGFERGITQNMTLAVNYVGDESHFLIAYGTSGANARGYWSNQLDPRYLAVLGPVKDTTASKPLLISAATAANVAILQQYFPVLPSNLSAAALKSFEAAAAVSSTATITQMLLAFPQYSGVTDTWGQNNNNFSYHSMQITLNQRLSQGLTFNANYTFSKNIGDDGTFRSGYPIPAAAISGGSSKNWKMDSFERSWTALNLPHTIHAFGVWQLPFGQGHIGNNNRLVRWAAGGWQLSGIYSFSSGSPIDVTWSGCSSSTYPGQGQCMPDLNPDFGSNRARINGKYGNGPNGYNTCNLGINAAGQTGCTQIPYINNTAFEVPQNVSPTSTNQYLLGNAPRSRALMLRNPNTWDVDSGLRRTFPIHENLKFLFEADCLNTWNHVTFGGPSGSWSLGSGSFGTIGSASGNRDWQFAGHLNF
jgi:hypothetical protein